MKKYFWVVGLFMLLMLPGISVSADPGPYVRAQGGIVSLMDSDLTDGANTLTMESKTGWGLGLAGGYNFGMFRVEGEVGYQKNGIQKIRGGGTKVDASGDVDCISFLGNTYLAFVNRTPFTPYISGGLGVARLEVKDFGVPVGGFSGFNGDSTVFAYQAGLGVGYAINKNFSIDLKYRYFGTADPEFDNVKAKINNHNAYLGFQYNF